MKRKAIIINESLKSWWPGDPRVEKYMLSVADALDRQNVSGPARTDIYNRCYEAVYQAINDYTPALSSHPTPVPEPLGGETLRKKPESK